MQRPLTALPEPREVPGVELVPFSWDRDDEVRRAHDASFTEHHGSAEHDADNVTGTLRLDESLGFLTTRTSVSWSVDRAPARGA